MGKGAGGFLRRGDGDHGCIDPARSGGGSDEIPPAGNKKWSEPFRLAPGPGLGDQFRADPRRIAQGNDHGREGDRLHQL